MWVRCKFAIPMLMLAIYSQSEAKSCGNGAQYIYSTLTPSEAF